MLLFGFLSAFRKIDIESSRAEQLADITQYTAVFKGSKVKKCSLPYLFTHASASSQLAASGCNWYQQWIDHYLQERKEMLENMDETTCCCLFIVSRMKKKQTTLCGNPNCMGISKSRIRDVFVSLTKTTSVHSIKTTSVNWIRKLTPDVKVWAYHAHHNHAKTTLDYYSDPLFNESGQEIEEFLQHLVKNCTVNIPSSNE